MCGDYVAPPMTHPTNVEQPEQDFKPFESGAAEMYANLLLRDQLADIRTALEECLRAIPDPGVPLTVSIEVYGQMYHVPAHPNSEALRRLASSLHPILGPFTFDGQQYQRTKRKPDRLLRSGMSNDAITQHPELFAALFAWGYLHPEEEWEDVIRMAPSQMVTGEQYRADVLRTFTAFLHGSPESGIRFNVGDRQFCFNPDAQGYVARVIALCCVVSPSEICLLERGEVVRMILQKHPDLRGIDSDATTVIEAMVAVIQTGVDVA